MRTQSRPNTGFQYAALALGALGLTVLPAAAGATDLLLAPNAVTIDTIRAGRLAPPRSSRVLASVRMAPDVDGIEGISERYYLTRLVAAPAASDTEAPVAPDAAAAAPPEEDANAPRLSFVVTPGVSLGDLLRDLLDEQAQWPAEVGQMPAPVVQPYRYVETGRSPLMMSLYISTAVTQALDIHSTLQATSRGGIETNPLLSGITGNTAAFIVAKSALTAVTIYAASRLAKKNRVAAVASLLAINAAYLLVAQHNYGVASGPR